MSDEEFEVERIAGRRHVKGREQFLIEWKGYSKDNNTWEGRENLLGNIGLVDDFESTYKAENPGKVVPKVGLIYLKGAHDIENPKRTSPSKPLKNKLRKPRNVIKFPTSRRKTQRTPMVIDGDLDITNPGRPSKKPRTDPAIISAIHYPAVPGRKSIQDVVETDEELESIKKSLDNPQLALLKLKHPLVEGLYGRRTFKSVTPPVYVVNEHDDTPFPEIFIYIDDLVLNDKVTPPDPDFLVGCDCDDKCLHVRGKKFCHEDSAYTNRGKLQENYTGAIYECNFSCKCDPETCPNRVVQRGRQVPLEIFKTARKGWGVRSTKRIKKNTFVEEYLGEVITEGEGALRGKLYDRIGLSYLFDMDLAGVDEYQKYVIDSYVCGNSSHFFNHSCNPNLVVYGVFHDSMDVSFHRLAFFANRDIEPNEELTFDYTGISQDDDDTKSKKFPCHCDADTCRHWIHL